MNGKQLWVAAFALFSLIGCASTEKPITQANVDQIRAGETTRADLVKVFGPPTTETVDMRGETWLEWDYAIRPGAQTYIPVAGPLWKGMKSEVQQLSVVLGPNGTVRRYSASSGPVPRTTTATAQDSVTYGSLRSQ